MILSFLNFYSYYIKNFENKFYEFFWDVKLNKCKKKVVVN